MTEKGKGIDESRNVYGMIDHKRYVTTMKQDKIQIYVDMHVRNEGSESETKKEEEGYSVNVGTACHERCQTRIGGAESNLQLFPIRPSECV